MWTRVLASAIALVTVAGCSAPTTIAPTGSPKGTAGSSAAWKEIRVVSEAMP